MVKSKADMSYHRYDIGTLICDPIERRFSRAVTAYYWNKIWMAGIMILLAVLVLKGCTGHRVSGGHPPDDCLRTAQARLDQTPAWDCLPTLDGQCVPLGLLFDACSALWPDCVLYSKFYLWESEVRQIVSQTPRGPVRHPVRIYHNILHTCRPKYHDSKRTHGDVAEFYDETGCFMGLAVYMGQGLYCPLPAPGPRATPDVH